MKDFGKIVVRQPLWSFKTLFKPNGETRALSEVLNLFLEDKVFREALFWSSPALFETLKKMEESPGKLSSEKKRKINESLQKYIIRAASRPTPFGIFAGVSLQYLTYESKENQAVWRHLEPNAALLQKIIQKIYNDGRLRDHLLFYSNNTLYSVGNEFRFLEVLHEQKLSPQISSFEKTEILEIICRMSKKRGISFKQFYDLFSQEFSREALQSYFYELVDSGFLISELEPKLTNGSPLSPIIYFLKRIKSQSPDSVERFQRVLQSLESYRTKVVDASLGEFYLQDYKELCTSLEKTGIMPSFKSLFHVTLSQPAPEQPVLTKRDRKNITESVRLVQHLFPKNKFDEELRRFKNQFIERYGSKTIPLLRALDPDIGIGFPANEHLGHKKDSFFNRKEESNTTGEPFLPEYLRDRIENHGNSKSAIEFKSSLWKNTDELLSFPKSFYIMGEKIGNGKILMQGIGNSPAYSLLARFSHSYPEIKDLCREIAEEEQKFSSHKIFADIIWTPNAKITDVLQRISPLNYEIPILYRGSKDNVHQILLEDLSVSVVRNKITLSSRRLKKEIVPRLSNAHHYKADKNPIYRFLCALQHPEGRLHQPNLAFGNTQKRYLPRLIYKNIMLSPAQWKLQKTDSKKITESPNPLEALHTHMNRWSIPNQVALIQGDRQLFLDLSQNDYAGILLREIKKRKSVLLREWLHTPKKDPYIQQFILPLKTKNRGDKESAVLKNEKKIKRSFPPGSEWLYFKIYCSSDFSDFILKHVYHQVIVELQQSSKLKKWFFIRYLDPHYHLRIRFHLTGTASISKVVQLINDTLRGFRNDEMVWKIQLDTYERELERYGAEHIVNSETVFWKDSECFIQCLEKAKIIENTQRRRLMGVFNLLNWRSLTDWDWYKQRDFCEQIFGNLKQEKSSELIKGVKKQYRMDRDLLYHIMDDKTCQEYFNCRSNSLKKLIFPPGNLKSYIHMSLNRWFKSAQRDWELLAYYYALNYIKYRLHRKNRP